MNIEIKGIGFGNRGAELMLCSIIDRLRQSIPDARFIVDPSVGSYLQRTKYGLYHKLSNHRSGRLGWLIDRFMHAGYRGKYGLIKEEEIDVLLDASGYAYGDAWEKEWHENSAKQILRYRKQGKKIILLPQAFGPFSVSRICAATEKILCAADLIYARDIESLKYVRTLAPDLKELHLAPDFTNILPGRLPEGFSPDPKRVCVIPNTQMIRYTAEMIQEGYLCFMARCIKHVRQRGYSPCILLHEGRCDIELARELQGMIDEPVSVIDEPDPVSLKGIIGSCAFTVGSRYHGLVSSFAQGVPAIGTSWSHKYQYLFEDYGCSEMLYDLLLEDAPPESLLDKLCDETNRKRLSNQLSARSRDLKLKTEQMWSRVERCLQS